MLVHRHKQVQARTPVKNQLQAMALSQGVQKKRKLWTEAGRPELEKLELLPYAAERRKQLLQALDGLEAEIEQLNRRVEAELQTPPAAGEVADASGSGTGDRAGHDADAGAGRAVSLGQVGSYFGLIPSEYSSGGQQKLGHISKQGSSFLRFLLVEAGQTAARYDAELGRLYRRLAVRKHRALAKVAVARKLAVRLYLMLREDRTYAQLCRAGRSCRQARVILWWDDRTDRLSRQPASPKSGEFEARIMGARTEAMAGGTRPPARLKEHGLGLGRQNLRQSEMALLLAPSEKC